MVEADGVWCRGWGWADLCVFVVASCRRKGGDGCCKKWGEDTLQMRNHLTSAQNPCADAPRHEVGDRGTGGPGHKKCSRGSSNAIAQLPQRHPNPNPNLESSLRRSMGGARLPRPHPKPWRPC